MNTVQGLKIIDAVMMQVASEKNLRLRGVEGGGGIKIK